MLRKLTIPPLVTFWDWLILPAKKIQVRDLGLVYTYPVIFGNGDFFFLRLRKNTYPRLAYSNRFRPSTRKHQNDGNTRMIARLTDTVWCMTSSCNSNIYALIRPHKTTNRHFQKHSTLGPFSNQRKTIVNSWVLCLENNQLVITSGFPTVNFRKW